MGPRRIVMSRNMLLAIVATLCVSGCSTLKPASRPALLPELLAVHADVPVKIDGRLDDAIWAQARGYALGLCQDRVAQGHEFMEGGWVRFAWDEQYLYMAVELKDSDVVAEGTADGEHHYAKGDVIELFLWPEAHTWYWELYVTPQDKQSAFFYPGAGRVLPSAFTHCISLSVAAQVQGTFNDWADHDQGWTGEMAVPVRALTRRGESWGLDASWRVLVGRYNYSAYLQAVELTAMPQLSKTIFHLREEYGRLRLIR